MSSPARAWSLRWRLPAIIMALLVAIGVAFTWTANREIRRALRVAGDERVRDSAAQLAGVLAQSAAARTTEARRLADDPAVRHFVLTGAGRDAALTVLRASGRGSPQAHLALSTRGETGTTTVALENVTIDRTRRPPGPATAVPSQGVGELIARDGRVSFTTTAAIVPTPDQPQQGDGILRIERPLTSSASTMLVQRLFGSGAVLKFGNRVGELWTDLSVSVSAPPRAALGSTIVFDDSAGVRRLGGATEVAGTPWVVWVEFEEAALMKPADTLLRRMLPWTAGLIVLGVLAVGVVSARLTAPIEQLAHAAGAIASGDYSTRITATGRDEIGRLGLAFDLMAARVAGAHETLEATVEQRTHELDRTREEMDQFFSMSLDLLCIADMTGTFIRVNPAWEKALGWTAADLTGAPFITLVHTDDVAATVVETARLREGGETLQFENRYGTKDGSHRWLSWKAVSNPDRGLIYAVARDVTDEKRVARELQRYVADLNASNNELEAFSYSVSHDLRAPLRSIDGFSQALLEDSGDRLGPDGKKDLRRIRDAAGRMSHLIDDLLELARVSREELQQDEVDLSGIAQSVLASFAEADPGRCVEWSVEQGLSATGDACLMEIALTNLLQNAWKFTGACAGAHIEFGACDAPGQPTEYFVRDNGAGFDQRYAAKLFDAFQRLHPAAEFPGSGIGLATVQRIISRHGGHVRAVGTPGLGATFSFTLHAPPHA